MHKLTYSRPLAEVDLQLQAFGEDVDDSRELANEGNTIVRTLEAMKTKLEALRHLSIALNTPDVRGVWQGAPAYLEAAIRRCEAESLFVSFYAVATLVQKQANSVFDMQEPKNLITVLTNSPQPDMFGIWMLNNNSELMVKTQTSLIIMFVEKVMSEEGEDFAHVERFFDACGDAGWVLNVDVQANGVAVATISSTLLVNDPSMESAVRHCVSTLINSTRPIATCFTSSAKGATLIARAQQVLSAALADTGFKMDVHNLSEMTQTAMLGHAVQKVQGCVMVPIARDAQTWRGYANKYATISANASDSFKEKHAADIQAILRNMNSFVTACVRAQLGQLWEHMHSALELVALAMSAGKGKGNDEKHVFVLSNPQLTASLTNLTHSGLDAIIWDADSRKSIDAMMASLAKLHSKT